MTLAKLHNAAALAAGQQEERCRGEAPRERRVFGASEVRRIQSHRLSWGSGHITPRISDAPMRATQNKFMPGARSLHALVRRER
jgi:hypothetical protein